MSCKSKARTVRWQRIRDVNTKPFGGERSAYWQWVKTYGFSGDDGQLREFPEANPDVLDSHEPTETPDVDTRALMVEAVKRAKLSKREKHVLKLIGFQGLTQEEAARRLGISRPTVQTTFRRAQKKILQMFVIISGDSSLIGREDTKK